MKKLFLLTILTIFAVSCESKNEAKMGGGAVLPNVKVVNDQDPICGMSTSVHMKDTLTYGGKLYGFCSTKCKEEFKKDPQKYVKNN